ncbi:SWIM zinc finger family protein [Chloroflexota bacterium]
MQSSLIGKIEKAKRYAQEKERVTFSELKASFKGDSDDHIVEYKDDGWHCTCDFFSNRGFCSHTMAMERILGDMLPLEARVTQLDTTP